MNTHFRSAQRVTRALHNMDAIALQLLIEEAISKPATFAETFRQLVARPVEDE